MAPVRLELVDPPASPDYFIPLTIGSTIASVCLLIITVAVCVCCRKSKTNKIAPVQAATTSPVVKKNAMIGAELESNEPSVIIPGSMSRQDISPPSIRLMKPTAPTGSHDKANIARANSLKLTSATAGSKQPKALAVSSKSAPTKTSSPKSIVQRPLLMSIKPPISATVAVTPAASPAVASTATPAAGPAAAPASTAPSVNLVTVKEKSEGSIIGPVVKETSIMTATTRAASIVESNPSRAGVSQPSAETKNVSARSFLPKKKSRKSAKAASPSSKQSPKVKKKSSKSPKPSKSSASTSKATVTHTEASEAPAAESPPPSPTAKNAQPRRKSSREKVIRVINFNTPGAESMMTDLYSRY